MNDQARAARLRRVEVQTCPRRVGELGPWKRDEGLDHWMLGRWAATQEEADAEVAEFMSSAGARGIGNVLWLYGGEQPRTCSFCGGIHPDDAIRLVRDGWRVVVTDKAYKRYLEPPAGKPHPVPPVKVYAQHFSEAQVAAINAAMCGDSGSSR